MIPSFSPDSINRKMAKLGLTLKNGRFDMSNLASVRINQALTAEAQIWCQQHYRDEWIWSSPIQTNYSDFYFMHEQDALAFKLRFGSVTA